MKRKIRFEVVISDGFTYSEPNGIDNTHLWPIPMGKSEVKDIDIEFEPSGGDVMKDAENSLFIYMKKKYPNKDYKIYYWDWLN